MSGDTRRGALLIGIGGGLGASCRYLLASEFAPPTPPDFPWVTFGINVTGALLLGFTVTMLATAWSEAKWVHPAVVVGFLGGFTTWSHFITESNQLIGAGETSTAILNIVASLGLGIVAASLGFGLARAAASRPKSPRAR